MNRTLPTGPIPPLDAVSRYVQRVGCWSWAWQLVAFEWSAYALAAVAVVLWRGAEYRSDLLLPLIAAVWAAGFLPAVLLAVAMIKRRPQAPYSARARAARAPQP